ncbi:unnamed protein product, partial [Musa textilis]
HFDSFEASPVSPHPLLGTSTWRLSLLIVAAANLTRRFLRRRVSRSLCSLFVPSLFSCESVGGFSVRFWGWCREPGGALGELVYPKPAEPQGSFSEPVKIAERHLGTEVHGVEYAFGAHD